MTEILDWGPPPATNRGPTTPMVWRTIWPVRIITHPLAGETMWVAHNRNKEPSHDESNA